MPWTPPAMQQVPAIKTQTPGLSGVLAGDDDFDTRPKTYAMDLNEADVLNLTIRMADGTNGSISIHGGTIAQIIMDRNAKAAQVQDAESTPTEIQVGDGDLNEIPVIPVRMVNADEILTASQRARQRQSLGKSPY